MSFGMSVVEFFDGSRGLSEFFSLMNSLPPHSKFKSKVLMDEDYARNVVEGMSDEQIRDFFDTDGPKEMSPEGYDFKTELLNQIIDEIAVLRNTVVGMVAPKGKKPPKFKPKDRPTYAVPKLAKERSVELEREDHKLVMQMLGSR